jgi:hypothetical protein
MNMEGIKQSIAEDHGFSDWDTLIDKLTESNELTLLKIYIDEVIVGYADAKIFDELEAPAMEFDNKVLKTLKSMTLSMAAHPDCVKGSEFFDLVSIAEKVLDGTLDTRHG